MRYVSCLAVLAAIVGACFLGCGTKQPAARTKKKPKPIAKSPAVAQPPATVEAPVKRQTASDKLSVEQLADRVKNSVALITALDSNGDEAGIGTGFVVGPALVATNFHVIREASAARVQLQDGTQCDVNGLRASDPDADIAILEIKDPPSVMHPVSFRAEDIRPGAAVVAIGHPSGFRFSITTGIVSGVHTTAELPAVYREFITAPASQLWIQTSAPISPGNSGGPLLDERGFVIGMNTWVAGGANLGFAQDIRHTQALLAKLSSEVTPLRNLAEPREAFKKILDGLRKVQARSGTSLKRIKAARVAAAEQLVELAEKHPNSPVSLEALSLVFLFDEQRGLFAVDEQRGLPESLMKRATDRILNDHLSNPRLYHLITNLEGASSKPLQSLLRKIVATGGKSNVQGVAAFALAGSLHSQPSPDDRYRDEIEALLTTTIREFGQVKVEGRSLASRATPLLEEVQRNVVGRPAPPTIGRDLTGKELALADSLGRVVLLAFWSHEELGDDSEFYTSLQTISQWRTGRSFAMLAVNVDEVSQLQRVADKLFCPIIHDGVDGPLSTRWGVEEFPQFFILDQRGNVRYRTNSLPLASMLSEELAFQSRTADLRKAFQLSPQDSSDLDAAGVIADRAVIWNQHNSYHRERGTKTFNLRLYHRGQEVWKRENIELPWAPDQDKNLTIELPKQRFDRMRVEVESWHHAGGGLAEVEVFQGDRNIARGCAVTGNSCYDNRDCFHASRVTDGATTSDENTVGYWVLPDATKGWADLDFSAPMPADSEGVVADRIVLWNTFNPPHNDRGAKSCTVRLLKAGREVWSKTGISVPWEANKDRSVTEALPSVKFDAVRVEIDEWHGNGGGLAEVQVFRGEEELSRACPVIDRCTQEGGFVPALVTDGIYRPREQGLGYWLLPNNTRGWVEIDLSGAGTEVGALRSRLGVRLAFLNGDWDRGAELLRRGDNALIRRVARRELIRQPGVYDELELAGAWGGVAAFASPEVQEGLAALTLKHYRHASLEPLDSETDAVIEERMARASAASLRRRYLYFMTESFVDGVEDAENIRNYNLVVDGRLSPFGLEAGPPANGTSRIVFSLKSPYRRFQGGAGIEQTGGGSDTPLTFRIMGDGKNLWESRPLKEARDSATFDLDITGIRELSLSVDCPGDNNGAAAVWLDPRVLN